MKHFSVDYRSPPSGLGQIISSDSDDIILISYPGCGIPNDPNYSHTIFIDNPEIEDQGWIGPELPFLFQLLKSFGIEKVYDSELEFETFCNDKDRVKSGFKIAVVSGNASAILTAERVVLNILQRMCGIATITNDYVKAISHTKARLVDTRKTTPGLRLFEKYAFYCGGGGNHRFGLDSGVMLKDNHIALFGNIFEAVKRIKERAPILTKVEVECDTVPQVEASINAGADLIMLDNMSTSEMKRAVDLVNDSIPLECSGNVNLDNIGEKAMTGVNYVSVGAITQSARCIDIGLDV